MKVKLTLHKCTWQCNCSSKCCNFSCWSWREWRKDLPEAPSKGLPMIMVELPPKVQFDTAKKFDFFINFLKV